MTAWSFLTNYGLVLTYVGRHPDSTGLEIARAVGVTERAARKILADLQSDGYVEWEKVGRRNRYRINTQRPVRLWGEGGLTVGQLLELLWSDADKARITGEPSLSGQRSPSEQLDRQLPRLSAEVLELAGG